MHERMQESLCLPPCPPSLPPSLHPSPLPGRPSSPPAFPSPPYTHVSNLAALCILDVEKKKEHFKVNEKKESLIRLAVALRSKLLSADVLQLKLAWVMSSDALQY